MHINYKNHSNHDSKTLHTCRVFIWLHLGTGRGYRFTKHVLYLADLALNMYIAITIFLFSVYKTEVEGFCDSVSPLLLKQTWTLAACPSDASLQLTQQQPLLRRTAASAHQPPVLRVILKYSSGILHRNKRKPGRRQPSTKVSAVGEPNQQMSFPPHLQLCIQ